jgi:hypothetical protein
VSDRDDAKGPGHPSQIDLKSGKLIELRFQSQMDHAAVCDEPSVSGRLIAIDHSDGMSIALGRLPEGTGEV